MSIVLKIFLTFFTDLSFYTKHMFYFIYVNQVIHIVILVDNVDNFVYNLIISGFADFCHVENFLESFSLIHHDSTGFVHIARMVFFSPIMPAFLRMYTQDETVIRMGLEYSTIVFLFSTVITISLFFEKLFQAVGRMKISMIALLVGCISNIILDPFLIWGIGFFPKMGIRGAALATGIGQVLTIAVYMVFYILKPIPVRVTPKALKTSKETDLSLYAIGVPAILNLALPSFLISFLNSVLAAYSDSYVVILGIYYKLQTFLYLPANGIIQGMRPLIGYNFGAREMKRVKKIFRLTLESSCVIMLLGTIICLLASTQLMSLFTTTPETIAAGSKALRIISAGFLVSAVSVTTSGAMEGLGKGTQSLVISLFRYVIVIMPIAWLLSRFLSPTGVWNSFWIIEVFTAAISVMVYRKTLKKA